MVSPYALGRPSAGGGRTVRTGCGYGVTTGTISRDASLFAGLGSSADELTLATIGARVRRYVGAGQEGRRRARRKIAGRAEENVLPLFRAAVDLIADAAVRNGPPRHDSAGAVRPVVRDRELEIHRRAEVRRPIVLNRQGGAEVRLIGREGKSDEEEDGQN